MASKNTAASTAEAELTATNDQKESTDSLTDTHMGELDKVRSILFGEQIKVYEDRIQQIEESLNQNISDVKAEIGKQIEDLDNRVKGQFDELLELIGKETHSRENQRDLLKAELEKVSGVLSDYQKVQDEKLGDLSASVKEALQGEMKGLEKELSQQIKSLSESSEKAITKIEDDTLKRSQLAELFAGLARQIAPDGNS